MCCCIAAITVVIAAVFPNASNGRGVVVKVSELEAVITYLEEQIVLLSRRVEALEGEDEEPDDPPESEASPELPFSYTVEVGPPRPFSRPLDIQAMAAGVFDWYSYYYEEGDVWGPGTYL
jgi:hypothetical protein